mgnify:CR=1 FL=1
MTAESPISPDLIAAFSQFQAGDPEGINRLLSYADGRLKRIARLILHKNPGVARWEGSDDLAQKSMIRLWRALQSAQIESPRHFLNLLSIQMRRELSNIIRKYFSPLGIGTHHQTPGKGKSPMEKGAALWAAEDGHFPMSIEQWESFHDIIDKLPERESEVVNLIFYQGWTQEETAGLLGVSLKTVKRIWVSAKLRIIDRFSRENPVTLDGKS